MLIQLDFLQNSETDMLKRELKDVHDMADKVRKGLFARHNELAKLFIDLDERLTYIERFICKN